MGKQQVHFEFEELIWRQFQELYPRQGRKIFEDTMKSMINFKLEITDEEGEKLKADRDKLQSKADHILSCLKEHDTKIRIWEAKKRKELFEQKKAEEEKDIIQNQKDDLIKQMIQEVD